MWLEMSLVWGFVMLGGFFNLVLNYMHLLSSLLSLEFLVLGLYWGLTVWSTVLGGNVFFLLYYLIMVVSEGVLGLALMVSLVYSFSSDYLKGYDSLMC